MLFSLRCWGPERCWGRGCCGAVPQVWLAVPAGAHGLLECSLPCPWTASTGFLEPALWPWKVIFCPSPWEFRHWAVWVLSLCHAMCLVGTQEMQQSSEGLWTVLWRGPRPASAFCVLGISHSQLGWMEVLTYSSLTVNSHFICSIKKSCDAVVVSSSKGFIWVDSTTFRVLECEWEEKGFRSWQKHWETWAVLKSHPLLFSVCWANMSPADAHCQGMRNFNTQV